MQLEVSVVSRAGARSVNEDAYGFWSAPGACFCVVSDGAGGHRGGDVASKLVVSEILGWFREGLACDLQGVSAALHAANQAVLSEQGRNPALADMRATAVVLAIDTKHALATWVHLGDSRLYGFRHGQLVTRTRDHSVAQRMIDTGYVSAAEFRGSPQRTTLFAAIGEPEGWEADLAPGQCTLQPGDAFLLCTDGWWEVFEDEELVDTLSLSVSPGEWLQRLESRIVARANKSQDNYSALAVWCSQA